MNTTQAIENFENQVVAAINASHLHPAIVRLVLTNLTHVILDKERELAKADAEAQPRTQSVGSQEVTGPNG